MLKWKIGDATVTRVLEQELPLPPDGLIPAFTPEAAARHADWLKPHFLDDAGQIKLAIHALVVESRGRRIVVDTCMGNDRTLPIEGLQKLSLPFLEDLARAGHPRESIDVVVCTHLHFDHVGWNTMWKDGAWVPTFENARYLIGREEYEHWQRDAHPFVDLSDTVAPVVEAGLHELVETDHAITDEVRLVPTPGHTPGHVSVLIESGGEAAVITGDMVHHPVQLAEPEWGSAPDVEPERAVETRRAFVERYGDRPVLVIGTHFATPTAGHLVRENGAIRFRV